MANRDDDPGAPKPLFTPPPKIGGVSGSSLFAPPAFPIKPPAATTTPSFGGWPDAPVERLESREDTRPVVAAKPVEDEVEPEPPVEVEPAKPEPAVTSASVLRAPVHARKTSTQAHSVVGEFGVPTASDDPDDAPPTPARRTSKPKRNSRPPPTEDPHDDPEQTDEDPKPLEPPAAAANEAPPSTSSPLPLLIGVGLAATLVVAIVVGMQPDRGPTEPSDDPPKSNRSEPDDRIVDVSKQPQPRPPGDSQTKLGDPDTKRPLEAATTEGDRADTDSESDTIDEDVDPRDPSVIPPGTPEDSVKAFLKLPVSIHDGPPLGGIGRTGIHVDDITTGREYRSGECKDQVRAFSIATDKEVSVCFRVVHDRDEESVRVLWDRNGVTTRRGGVRIRDLHAYKTRAYLELRPEYVGTWRVRIISDDDVELAAFEFEITA